MAYECDQVLQIIIFSQFLGKERKVLSWKFLFALMRVDLEPLVEKENKCIIFWFGEVIYLFTGRACK